MLYSAQQVDRFSRELSLISGGTHRLGPADLSSSHPLWPPSQICYQIVQLPVGGIRLKVTDGDGSSLSLLDHFNQSLLDEGRVVVEHLPVDESQRWALIGLKLHAGNEDLGELST